MAVIYLKHSQHGSKVACSHLEAEYDELNGWERYDPNESYIAPIIEEKSASEAEILAPVNTLEVKSRRRKTTE